MIKAPHKKRVITYYCYCRDCQEYHKKLKEYIEQDEIIKSRLPNQEDE